MSIHTRGFVNPSLFSRSIMAAAHHIKRENYKVTHPRDFGVHRFEELTGAEILMDLLTAVLNQHLEDLDVVFFSCCKGAEPHTDLLDPAKFHPTTYVIPVILPEGESVIFTDTDKVTAKLGMIYEFNHEETHGMTVEDEESGCVVLMIAVRKST